MKIVWDEPKRQTNLVKHGMDFSKIDLDFFVNAVTGPAKRGRRIAVGEINGIVAVIFAELGTEAVSVVSMRPASAKERIIYGKEV